MSLKSELPTKMKEVHLQSLRNFLVRKGKRLYVYVFLETYFHFQTFVRNSLRHILKWAKTLSFGSNKRWKNDTAVTQRQQSGSNNIPLSFIQAWCVPGCRTEIITHIQSLQMICKWLSDLWVKNNLKSQILSKTLNSCAASITGKYLLGCQTLKEHTTQICSSKFSWYPHGLCICLTNVCLVIKYITLFLSSSSGETVIQQERASSPGPSCLSMKSDWSMELPVTLKKADNTPEQWYINISFSFFT